MGDGCQGMLSAPTRHILLQVLIKLKTRHTVKDLPPDAAQRVAAVLLQCTQALQVHSGNRCEELEAVRRAVSSPMLLL